MIIHKTCRSCKKDNRLEIAERDYKRWLSGVPIQMAMPRLSADDRELLVSGICGKCFDKMFGGEE